MNNNINNKLTAKEKIIVQIFLLFKSLYEFLKRDADVSD